MGSYMEYFDRDTIVRMIKTVLVLVVALSLFIGLRGRVQRFAEWAGLPRLALAPVRLIFHYSILAVAAMFILSLWEFEIGTILALMGSVLGLVAIGFVAVWSVLSNFLCTFVLVMFKPFSVGDELELPPENIKGRVTDLSLIFTTLEVSPGELVLIPNNTFFQRMFKRRRGIRTTGLGEHLQEQEASSVPANAAPSAHS
jgi:small-conductance mechanosensitive channel